jgi:hypothetical protein
MQHKRGIIIGGTIALAVIGTLVITGAVLWRTPITGDHGMIHFDLSQPTAKQSAPNPVYFCRDVTAPKDPLATQVQRDQLIGLKLAVWFAPKPAEPAMAELYREVSTGNASTPTGVYALAAAEGQVGSVCK